ncbi:MAG: hypothetical protein M3Y50_03415 [Acidobacteriota bacterium]|nr:hypothetical protein [Acidobacteriota bacterium]
MRHISKVLMFGAMGCLLCCSAPVVLLIVGGGGLGAAVVEWRHFYRDPSFLTISGTVGLVFLMIGLRDWRVRKRARRISLEPNVLPPLCESATLNVPIACTLVASDLKLRLEELAELSRDALAFARRDDLTLHLHYFPEAREKVRQMVEKEQACCPFLLFDFEPHPAFLALRITAPETARAAIHEVYAQFVLTEAVEETGGVPIRSRSSVTSLDT